MTKRTAVAAEIMMVLDTLAHTIVCYIAATYFDAAGSRSGRGRCIIQLNISDFHFDFFNIMVNTLDHR